MLKTQQIFQDLKNRLKIEKKAYFCGKKMKTLSEYISPLLEQLGQKQVRANTKNLSEKLLENQTGQLWSLSEDKNEYNRNLRLLNGSLQTVVDVSKLNVSLLVNSVDFFKNKVYIIVLHDGSDIRKPWSKELEHLDVVRDLEGKLIAGYPTFNSIAIDLQGKQLRLLQSTPYSTKEKTYLSQTDINDYHANKLLKQRRGEVKSLLDSGDWYNHNSIVHTHVNQINAQIRQVNPHAIVIHVYDRGHDSVALFQHHDKSDSFFIVRLKLNRNSNELCINKKGKEVAVKLSRQQFLQGHERYYDKIRFKNKTYFRVKGVFEWSKLEIEGKIYSVVKVRFYTPKGKSIFGEPMLLLTNMEVYNEALTELVFEIYLKRVKIEGVFKFCKQELGWENFRIRDFEGIKNLLALVYFIAGYFYEIEHEIVKHPAAQWLAQLGNGKGKVTSYYILKGIGKLAHFLNIQQMLQQTPQNKELAQLARDSFLIKKIDLE